MAEESSENLADTVSEELTGDAEYSTRVLTFMFEAFWQPEIERRGGVEATGPIHKALAVLYPGRPVEVQLNDEFELVARAKVNSELAPGTPVTLENLDAIVALEPLGVGPDAGWVAWVVLPDGRQMAQFDFVRNRGRSLRLLGLARDYLDTASEALEAGRTGPALENSMAAAELAITAQTYTFSTEVPAEGGRRNAHSARKHWTKVQVGLGNTTADAHHTLVALNELRGASRYGEGDVGGTERAMELLESVKRLVEDTRARVGELMRTQDPDFIARLGLVNRPAEAPD